MLPAYAALAARESYRSATLSEYRYPLTLRIAGLHLVGIAACAARAARLPRSYPVLQGLRVSALCQNGTIFERFVRLGSAPRSRATQRNAKQRDA